MNYDAFIKSVNDSQLVVFLENEQSVSSHRLSNEALFHLPLLAMTVLLLAGDRSKPKCAEIGQLVGECFENTFVGFKRSKQLIGWSANLRMRTVQALTFLELTELVQVEISNQRLSITSKGRKILDKALDSDTDLGYSLNVIRRNYRNIRIEKQMSLGLQ